MKKKLLGTCLIAMLTVFSSFAQNNNIANLVSSNDWNTLFPKRAGTTPAGPQGYTTDFYSYQNFLDAADEISDYEVTYSSGINQSTSISVRRKSTNTTYSFSITSAAWSGGTTTVDFGDFCNTGDTYNDERELAAFFANITKETTGGNSPVGSGLSNSHESFGLYFVNEVSTGNCYTNGSRADYSPVGGQCYSGRGPIQLSYYYNYGYFSEFLYNDTRLVNDPSVLSQDGKLAFMSAIWFWMTPQCPKPSCHQAMHEIHDETAGNYSAAKMRLKGFAHTNNIINGGLECRSGSSFEFSSKVALRSDLYQYYLGVLGFSQAEINLENSSTYTTTCYDNFSNAMQDYSTCAFRTVVSNCTQPELGADQNYCSTPIVLDINATLRQGDVVTWYKNDQLEIGQGGSTYTVTEAGTYRAQIQNAGSCTRVDEIFIGQGGEIQASVSNEGYFCDGVGPNEVTISVTGGGGNYNLYDVNSGGSPIATGGSFTIDQSDLALGTQQTYYVAEPAGQQFTVGFDARLDGDVFEFIDTSRRTAFTTETNNVTLQSIDFALAYIGDAFDHKLVVNLYAKGEVGNPIASKSFDIAQNEANWGGLTTFLLDFEIPTAGDYEIGCAGTAGGFYVKQIDFGSDIGFGNANMREAGIAAIVGTPVVGDGNYPLPYAHIQYGTFNWVFSTGSNSSCGRSPVTVYHDCTTSSDELAAGSFNIFPNPASNNMNISFSNINAATATVEVYNSFGQLVVTELVNGVVDQAQFTIPTADLNSGLYVVRVVAANKTYNASVVVSK